MRGPRGLTPMHLAALSPAAAALSRLLAAKCAPGPAAWFWVAADDGLTPASFAERLGTPERNAEMLQRAIVARAPLTAQGRPRYPCMSATAGGAP